MSPGNQVLDIPCLFSEDDECIKDQPESSNKSRGATIGSSQNKKRKRIGGKFAVKYNDMGVPYGEEAEHLASYAGVLARTSVSIFHSDWRLVSQEMKDRLWESVKVTILYYYNF